MNSSRRRRQTEDRSLGDLLIQTMENFKVENVQHVGQLTFLIQQLLPLLPVVTPDMYEDIQKIHLKVKFFFIKRHRDLLGKKFRTNSFNITDPEFELKSGDIEKKIKWRKEMARESKKYGFVKLPINGFGVIMHKEHNKMIENYIPSDKDLSDITYNELKNIHKIYMKFHKRTLAMTEHVCDLADFVFMFWMACRVSVTKLMRIRELDRIYIGHTVNDMVYWMPDIDSLCESQFIDIDKFCSIESYRVARLLQTYSVDELSQKTRNKKIEEMDLRTAIHITQLIRTGYWFIPFAEQKFRICFEAFCSRVAEILIDKGSTDVLNVEDLTVSLDGLDLTSNGVTYTDIAPVEQEPEVLSTEENISFPWLQKKETNKRPHEEAESSSEDGSFFMAGSKKKDVVVPQIHTYRIFHSLMRGIWAMISFRADFKNVVELTESFISDKFSKRDILNFLVDQAGEIDLSEPEVRRMIKNITSMYMGPGVRYLFQLLNPFMNAETNIVVPVMLGGRPYSHIVSTFSTTSPADLISNPTLANHLKMIVCLHVLESHFTLKDVPLFMKKFVLWPHRLQEIRSCYETSNGSYPKIAVIANEFVIIHNETVYTANNQPTLLLGYFFYLIAEFFECRIGKIPIYDSLNMMKIKSTNLKNEYSGNIEYKELLFNVPDYIF